MLVKLMKKTDYTKLQLFQVISSTTTISTTELSLNFHLSYSSVERQIVTLNNTLKEITGSSYDIIIKIKQNYSINHESCKIIMGDLYHSLKCYYLKKSLNFQLLVELIIQSKTDTQTLSEVLHVSDAHVYRLLSTLKDFLSPINLTIKKNEGNHEISGDEMVVRTTIYLIMTTVYHLSEWPFLELNRDYLPLIENDPVISSYSISVQHKLIFLLAITIIRLKKGNQLHRKFEPSLISFLEVIMQENDLTESFVTFPPHIRQSIDSDWQERALFNFLIRFLVADCDSEESKQVMGKQFISLTHPLTSFCYAFSREFLEAFSLTVSVENLADLMYYSVIYHFAECYLDTDAWELAKLNHELPNVLEQYIETKEVRDVYQFFLDHSRNKLVCVPKSFVNYFSHILVLFLKTKQDVSVSVFIYYSKNIIGERFLKKQIAQMFNNQTVIISKSPERADILISDSNHVQTKKGIYFFLWDVYDVKLLSTLFTLIQSVILKKKFKITI